MARLLDLMGSYAWKGTKVETRRERNNIPVWICSLARWLDGTPDICIHWPGGYRFKDCLKMGISLNFVILGVVGGIVDLLALFPWKTWRYRALASDCMLKYDLSYFRASDSEVCGLSLMPKPDEKGQELVEFLEAYQETQAMDVNF